MNIESAITNWPGVRAGEYIPMCPCCYRQFVDGDTVFYVPGETPRCQACVNHDTRCSMTLSVNQASASVLTRLERLLR